MRNDGQMWKAGFRIAAAMFVAALFAASAWWLLTATTFVVVNWRHPQQMSGLVLLVSFVALWIAARIAAGGPARAAALVRDEESRQRRSDIYLRLLEAWTTDLTAANRTQWRQLLWRVEQELALCGERHVIAQYTQFRRQAHGDGRDIGPALAGLLKAMRKDIRRQDFAAADELIDIILREGDE